MKKLFILATLITSLTIMGLTANAQGWAGKYEFSEDGGRTAGGTAIFVGHELVIAANGSVTIKSAGYQTSIDLVATAKEENGKLNIYFASYGEDNMFDKYQPGDLLFSLEKRKVKGATRLLTTWGKFEPVVDKKVNTGLFFKKV